MFLVWSLITAMNGGLDAFAIVNVLPAIGVIVFALWLLLWSQHSRATMDASVASQIAVINGRNQHQELMRHLRHG